MHAIFPMLAAWSGACSCRQRFWAVFFQLTGLCSLLQEQLQIPRHMTEEKQQKWTLILLAVCLIYLSTLCTYIVSFMVGSPHLYKLNAEHTWHRHEYGNIAHHHISALSCQDKYGVVSCCYPMHWTPLRRPQEFCIKKNQWKDLTPFGWSILWCKLHYLCFTRKINPIFFPWLSLFATVPFGMCFFTPPCIQLASWDGFQ